MNLDRFLTLLATIIGLIGSVFLLKGALGLTPDIMAKLAETGWWFNPSQINGLATQKANAICGAFVVLSAFLITVLRLVFVDDKIPCFDSRGMAVAVVILVSAAMVVALLFVNQGIASYERRQIGTAIIGRRVDELLQRGKIGVEQAKELLATAEKLLALDLSALKDSEAAFKKVVEATGRKIPDQFDLSPLRKNIGPAP